MTIVAGLIGVLILSLFPIALLLTIFGAMRVLRETYIKLDHDDEELKHLRWGLYFNPEDKRVFIPNAHRLGWHLNYGSRLGLIIATIHMFIFICVVSKMFFHAVALFKFVIGLVPFYLIFVHIVYLWDYRHLKGDNAQYWRWGLYYNKTDKRTFVPNVFRWGWSFNYGNRAGAVLGAIYYLILVSILCVFLFHSHGNIIFGWHW